jgi:hypothetical protein
MHQMTSELMDAVRQAAAGTGYEVTPTDDGFRVQRDLADVRWWGPLSKSGVKRLVAHLVRADPEAKRLTITDELRTVGWRAGAQPEPFWTGNMEMMRGRITSSGFRKSYGVREDGTFGVLEHYSFSTREGRDLVRDAARELGWTERMPVEAKIGLGFGIVAAVGAVVTAIVLVTAALLGKF